MQIIMKIVMWLLDPAGKIAVFLTNTNFTTETKQDLTGTGTVTPLQIPARFPRSTDESTRKLFETVCWYS